jgi:hypothetical protein
LAMVEDQRKNYQSKNLGGYRLVSFHTKPA